MAYAVVEFNFEQGLTEVEVVPSSWLFDNNRKCWWPDKVYYTNTKILSLIKSKASIVNHDIDKEWKQYCVHVLYTDDDYLKIRQKCKLAEETSNLETDNPDSLPARASRKRKKNRRYEDDVGESSEDEIPCSQNRKNLPPAPNIVIPTDFETARPSVSQSSRRYALPGLTTSPRLTLPQPTPPRPTPQQAAITETAPLPDVDFKHKILMEIEVIKSLTVANSRLLKTLISRPHTTDYQDEDINESFPTLPLCSFNDMEQFNTKLTESSTSRKKLYNILCMVGGKTLSGVVQHSMPLLISNELAKQFSFRGRKGKLNFSQFKSLVAVINRSVRSNPYCRTIDDHTIGQQIGEWLKHAFGRKRKDTANKSTMPNEITEDPTPEDTYSDVSC